MLPREAEEFKFSAHPHAMNFYEADPYHYREVFPQDQIGVPLQATPSSTISGRQKFTLHEISPDWGYANETTKVYSRFFFFEMEICKLYFSVHR